MDSFDFAVKTSAGSQKVKLNNPYGDKPTPSDTPADSGNSVTKNGYQMTHSVSTTSTGKRVQANVKKAGGSKTKVEFWLLGTFDAELLGANYDWWAVPEFEAWVHTDDDGTEVY